MYSLLYVMTSIWKYQMYFCGRYWQEKSQKPYVIAKSISACMYRTMIYLWSLRIYFHSLFLWCVFGGSEVNIVTITWCLSRCIFLRCFSFSKNTMFPQATLCLDRTPSYLHKPDCPSRPRGLVLPKSVTYSSTLLTIE